MVNLDVAFVPTPKLIVRSMLHLASLRRGETLFDLGAGDGRIIIEAARRFGARAIGIEIDPNLANRIRERIAATKSQAELIEADFFTVDLTPADVVAIYLSASTNERLAPKLSSELRTGARVVSLDYELPGWRVSRQVEVKSSGIGRELYLYKKT